MTKSMRQIFSVYGLVILCIVLVLLTITLALLPLFMTKKTETKGKCVDLFA